MDRISPNCMLQSCSLLSVIFQSYKWQGVKMITIGLQRAMVKKRTYGARYEPKEKLNTPQWKFLERTTFTEHNLPMTPNVYDRVLLKGIKSTSGAGTPSNCSCLFAFFMKRVPFEKDRIASVGVHLHSTPASREQNRRLPLPNATKMQQKLKVNFRVQGCVGLIAVTVLNKPTKIKATCTM